jgi:hypothetical protein
MNLQKPFVLLVILLLYLNSYSQTVELYQTISKLDSTFFQAYNN